MGIPKKDLSALTDAVLNLMGPPTWQTPSDLARISIDAMSTSMDVGRQMVSLGILRLTGDGVESSRASMEAVGELMTRWQRLVTAIGGSKRGFTGLRGRMNAEVVASTRLLLDAGPAAGSLMLQFQPETLPTTELSPDGEVELFDRPENQLADEAVSEAMSLFEAVTVLGPDADGSLFLEEVSGLGPRSASALAEMAKSIDASGFNLDVTWRQPGQPTVRARLNNSDARRIVEIVTSRELDSDVETITGSIQTISDRARLHILLDDGELVAIGPGKLDHDALRPISHGDRVDVKVDVKMIHRPGEEPVPAYSAKSITKRVPSED